MTSQQSGNLAMTEPVPPLTLIAMKKLRFPRPICRRINPESDVRGYYCQTCGMSLTETKSGWFRHGDEWQHPEVMNR